ncbi:hypothetical protein [uncultured Shewanella sp.]|uniref:hypothetical protein n=1 Tax=uncultured Shewanella sp. TaxID=173975 RepID=UPI0026294F54|nr:hypothetical protein [uncultured Shewanella sp.]
MTLEAIKRAATALKNKKSTDSYALSHQIKAQILARKMSCDEINHVYAKTKIQL